MGRILVIPGEAACQGFEEFDEADPVAREVNDYTREITERLGPGYSMGMTLVGLAHYTTVQEISRFEGIGANYSMWWPEPKPKIVSIQYKY